MFQSMDLVQNIYTLITISNLLLALTVIFMERKDVGVTWAWLMVLLFLPVVGFVLYIVFGQNLSRLKLYKIGKHHEEIINRVVDEQRNQFAADQMSYHDPKMSNYRDLIYMNLTSGYAMYTQDNTVEMFTDGNVKFDSLLRDIDKAERHIHLMYFIVKNDGLGKRLMASLVRKAQQGVEVRFLVDDIGSYRLTKRYFAALIAAGGHAAAFFPTKIPYLNFRVNYRNHRKLAIVDGTYGYIGGFNIGDEYLGLSSRFGIWRDTHLKMTGSAVLQMQAQFILDWNLSSASPLGAEQNYFRLKTPSYGNVGVQIVSSGPNNALAHIRNAYIKMIHAAKESIYIQTPYFIPDESLLTALKVAVLSGVDVKVMIPGKPDHKMVYWASFSYLGDLLAHGMRCYLYRKGFMHAKTMVIDGKIASVGTANVDIRSFKLNFEVNALIFDTKAASRLKEIFEEDMQFSEELTYDGYVARPRLHRLRESCTRLLSPIL